MIYHSANVDPGDRLLFLGFSSGEIDLIRRALGDLSCSFVPLKSIKSSIQQIFYDDYVAALIRQSAIDEGDLLLLEEAKNLAPWRGFILLGEDASKASFPPGVMDAALPLSEGPELRQTIMPIFQRRHEWSFPLSVDQITRFNKLFYHLRSASLTALKEQDTMRSLDLIFSTMIKHMRMHFLGLLDTNEADPFFVLEYASTLSSEEADRLAARITTHIRMIAPAISEPAPALHPRRQLLTCNPESVPYSLLPIITENRQTAWLFLSISRVDYPVQIYHSFLVQLVHYMSSMFTTLQRLRNLAFKDALTGLYNRRYMEEAGKRMFYLGQRYGHDIAVLFIDLDHFKQINDRLGHDTGDQALMQVADILTRRLRQSDIIARYGGDEFLVVLPHTSSLEAEHTAHRICADARNNPVGEGTEALPLSLSIGIALSSGEHRDFSETIRRADEALLNAKTTGGNQVVQWNAIEMEQELTRIRDLSAPTAPAEDFTEEQKNQPGILLVDDDPIVLQYIRQLLRQRAYRVMVALSSEEAVRLLEAHPGAVDLLITDINLPDMNGFELLKKINDTAGHIVSIVISSDLSTERAILSIRHGAYDIVQKPFTGDQLFLAVDRALDYHRLTTENRSFHQQLIQIVNKKSSEHRRALEQLKEAYQYTLDTMVAMLDAREQYTSRHSLRVRNLTIHLAGIMGFKPSAIKEIGQGALLHDIGKIAVADAILLKPGPLSAEERRIMEQHPRIGYSFLENNEALRYAAELVLSHHERWDGSGYPRGLKGEDILIGARIFSVIDCYDAIRSRRVYKPPFSAEESLRMIQKDSGKLYDPAIVDLFTQEHAAMENIGQWENENAQND